LWIDLNQDLYLVWETNLLSHLCVVQQISYSILNEESEWDCIDRWCFLSVWLSIFCCSSLLALVRSRIGLMDLNHNPIISYVSIDPWQNSLFSPCVITIVCLRLELGIALWAYRIVVGESKKFNLKNIE
jgi:hypothetical protein